MGTSADLANFLTIARAKLEELNLLANFFSTSRNEMIYLLKRSPTNEYFYLHDYATSLEEVENRLVYSYLRHYQLATEGVKVGIVNFDEVRIINSEGGIIRLWITKIEKIVA